MSKWLNIILAHPLSTSDTVNQQTTNLSLCLPVWQSTYPSVCLFVYLSSWLSVYLAVKGNWCIVPGLTCCRRHVPDGTTLSLGPSNAKLDNRGAKDKKTDFSTSQFQRELTFTESMIISTRRTERWRMNDVGACARCDVSIIQLMLKTFSPHLGDSLLNFKLKKISKCAFTGISFLKTHFTQWAENIKLKTKNHYFVWNA